MSGRSIELLKTISGYERGFEEGGGSEVSGARVCVTRLMDNGSDEAFGRGER